MSRSKVTITRPANADAYTAGDTVGGVFEIPLVAGRDALITSVDLQPQIAAIPVGMTSFRLHLYDVTPPSAIADNAAWTLPADDRASYLGYVDLGSPADVGATLFTQVDQVNKQIRTQSSSIFGYLVTNGGFTPAGNSEVYVLNLHTVGM